jgi:hypothetical protein
MFLSFEKTSFRAFFVANRIIEVKSRKSSITRASSYIKNEADPKEKGSNSTIQ